jgi:hypothetical protein
MTFLNKCWEWAGYFAGYFVGMTVTIVDYDTKATPMHNFLGMIGCWIWTMFLIFVLEYIILKFKKYLIRRKEKSIEKYYLS